MSTLPIYNPQAAPSVLSVAEALKVHTAMHDGSVSVEIRGVSFPFMMTKPKGGLRKVDVWGVPFMEQNKLKGSRYALMARGGKRLTWIGVGTWMAHVQTHG